MSRGNDPAFASPGLYDENVGRRAYEQIGLTKREVFAAMAMQGLLANADEVMGHLTERDVAEVAVRNADALLAALEDA